MIGVEKRESFLPCPHLGVLSKSVAGDIPRNPPCWCLTAGKQLKENPGAGPAGTTSAGVFSHMGASRPAYLSESNTSLSMILRGWCGRTSTIYMQEWELCIVEDPLLRGVLGDGGLGWMQDSPTTIPADAIWGKDC